MISDKDLCSMLKGFDPLTAEYLPSELVDAVSNGKDCFHIEKGKWVMKDSPIFADPLNSKKLEGYEEIVFVYCSNVVCYFNPETGERLGDSTQHTGIGSGGE